MNENINPPYRYIAVEGAIGAGKTTLCELLQKKYGCGLILETFADNPFLARFYQNPEKYALPVELFFLTERRRQLVEYWSNPDNLPIFTVADYFFEKSRIFAERNLPAEEYRLYLSVFDAVSAGLPKPDLLVYLFRNVGDLKKNILKRGRPFEKEISEDYLSGIQQAYRQFILKEKNIPVLWLDADQTKFLDQIGVFDKIVRLISQKYLPGLHIFKLREV